jgi:metal-responsive CopG/Arc/MetJ family transcriptional regulator
MNITLPDSLVKKLEKATDNKSAFIARAVRERLEAIKKEDFHRRLEESYREAAKHPEWEKDERDDW